jgi:UDP-4-amino-4,6-dideoxy-N-acetyl-beta-L-altrosamine transaminase
VTDKFLPYGRHSINQSDINAVVEVLKSDFLTTGPAVEQFEQLLAEKTQSQFAIACNSGTAALHMAAYAIGLKQNDAVIVPSITFLASANAMSFTGAEVFFSDCDPATGLMTPENFEDAILRAKQANLSPKAVVPVHLAGQMCDMEAIAKTARREGMFVIEDACHAIGTNYGPNSQQTAGDCRWSDMTAFSFHPVKTIAMGEGGAVTTNSPDLSKKLKLFRNHGMTRAADTFAAEELGKDRSGEWGLWYYEMSEPGYNYRASDILCALGYSQLKRLDLFRERRRELRTAYYGMECELPDGIRLSPQVTNCQPCPHLMIALFENDFLGMGRNHVMSQLKSMGIGTQVHYIPVHLQPYYRNLYPQLNLPGAVKFYRSCLSLPLYHTMDVEDVRTVIQSLRKIQE